MKNECEIIKDLLPNYIENLLSDETKKYVEQHINNCDECKKLLQMMKAGKQKEINKEEEEEQIELDYLKKHRKKTLILKILAFAFIIVILIYIIGYSAKFIQINSILNRAENKRNELMEANNYTIYTTQHYIDYRTNRESFAYDEYYCGDGKYKKIFRNYSINSWRLDGTNINEDEIGITYGVIDSHQESTVYNKSKKIINNKTNYKINSKGKAIRMSYISIGVYFEDMGFLAETYARICMTFDNSVTSERFMGRDCYVFRIKNNNYCKEIWLDKETFIPIKEVEDYYGQSYRETRRSFYLGNVDEKDVEFNQEDYEGYTIENTEYLIEDERAREVYERM